MTPIFDGAFLQTNPKISGDDLDHELNFRRRQTLEELSKNILFWCHTLGTGKAFEVFE